jgi:hypothetical protein
MSLADGVSFLAASPGTGTFAFGSSRASFLTLAQAVSDGELVNGQIVSYLAQDSATSPTQREWGHGTFSSAGSGSIARSTILGGSAGPGTAVNFSVAPIVSLTVLAEDLNFGAARTVLTADTNYYVNSSTGSDTNNGSSGAPFQTLQHAYNFLANTIDGAGFALTINLAGTGPYTLLAQVPWVGLSFVNINGAGSTTTRINDLFFAPVVGFPTPTVICVNNVLLGTATSANDLQVYGGNVILGATIPSNATGATGFGSWALAPCSGGMLQTVNPFAVLNIYGTGTLNAGTSSYFLAAGAMSFIANFAGSVTIQAGSTFTSFVDVSENALIEDHCTSYVGSPTNTKQFYAGSGGNLVNSTGSTSFWPGDKPGWIVPAGRSGFAVTLTASPTTGGTVLLSSCISSLILTPAGALAALTLQLPTAATVFQTDGFICHVVSTQTITALTVTTTDGSSVVGAPASLTANIPFALQYNATNNTWYPYLESGAGGGGGSGRTLLTANTSYYVNSSTGSDSNPGTSGSPWQTLQHAWNYLSGSIDGAGFKATINLVGAGPYTLVALSGFVGFQSVSIIGAGSGTTTINNIQFGAGWSTFVTNVGRSTPNTVNLGCGLYIDSVNFVDSGSGTNSAFWTLATGLIMLGTINGDVKFTGQTTHSASDSLIFATGSGVQIYLAGTVTLTGNPYSGIWVSQNARIFSIATIVFSGSPVFVTYLWCTDDANFFDVSTYSGTAGGGIWFSCFMNGGYDINQAIPSGLGPGIAVMGGMAGTNPPWNHTVATPTTGTTVTMSPSFPELFLNPAGPLASLTIDLPFLGIGGSQITEASFLDNFRITISTTQPIATLTLATTDGTTIAKAPKTLAAGAGIELVYDLTTTTWFPADGPPGQPGVFNVDDYYAGGTNDATAINNCATAAAAYATGGVGPRAKILFTPGKTYTCNAQITFDPGLVEVDMQGATMSFPTLTGNCVVLSSSAQSPSGGFLRSLANGVLVGSGYQFVTTPSTATTQTLIALECSGILIDSMALWNTGTAIDGSANNVYLCTMQNVLADSVMFGFKVSTNPGNSGETMVWRGGGMSATCGVYTNNTNGEIFLSDMSIDNFNTGLWTNGGLIVARNIHFETNQNTGPANNYYPFTVSQYAGNTMIILESCDFVYTGSSPAPTPFSSVGKAPVGIYAKDCTWSAGFSLASVLSTNGGGAVYIRGSQQDNSPAEACPPVIDINNTRNGDPNFNAGSGLVVDSWMLTKDSATITSRLSGTNISITTNTTKPFTGNTYALAATKGGASSTAAGFGLLVPIDYFPLTPTAAFEYAASANSLGTVKFNIWAVNLLPGPTLPPIGQEFDVIFNSQVGTHGVVVTPTTTYQAYSLNPPNSPIPTWATHLLFEFDMLSMGAGTFYIGQMQAFQI